MTPFQSTESIKHCTRRRLAIRTHHKRIAKAKARGVFYDSPWFTNRHQLKTTGTPCSCEMCRNPRNQKQAAKYRLSPAELRANDAADFAIADFFGGGGEWHEEAYLSPICDEAREAENVEHYIHGITADVREIWEHWDDYEFCNERYWDYDAPDPYDPYDPYCDDWEEDYHDDEGAWLQYWWAAGVSDPEHFRCKQEEEQVAWIIHLATCAAEMAHELDTMLAEVEAWEEEQETRELTRRVATIHY